jgi:hypothetical protein
MGGANLWSDDGWASDAYTWTQQPSGRGNDGASGLS